MQTTHATRPTMWNGWLNFASYMMMIAGGFELIAGLAALFQHTVYLVTENNLFAFSFTQWGIVHIALGLIMFTAGISLLAGKMWGRIVGVILASLSAIANFAFIDAYPWWSLAIIAIDVLVIYAIIVHGSGLREE